jgi:xylulokinase
MTNEIECALLGIDVGTSGARALAVSPTGKLLAEAEAPIRHDRRAVGGIHEQDPDEWWQAACSVAQKIAQNLKEEPGKAELRGVAVTSTSGTLVVADAQGRPLRPAILYDDGRGVEIADELNRQGGSPSVRLGPSFSLVKAAWVARHEPELWERTRYILSPSDWLCGKLTGEFGISDFTNALKLGYDPESAAWVDSVRAVGLPADRLPVVRRPGQPIGQVGKAAAAETGLAPGVPVLAGATDGMASVIASGASMSGDANTTLGTTLVWKVLDNGKPAAHGGVYFHLHPGGLWVPGAASNTGLGSIRRPDALPGDSPAEMDRLAARYFPTPVVCYMLSGEGERYPFAHPTATSFVDGSPRDAAESFAAQLQSMAFVERWGYEILESCGIKVGEKIFSTGAAARSPVLSQLRASVLGKTILLPRYPTAAFGAAILAATGTVFAGDVVRAIQSMSAILETYSPSAELGPAFDAIYSSFRDACARRGYGAPNR